MKINKNIKPRKDVGWCTCGLCTCNELYDFVKKLEERIKDLEDK